MARALFVCLHNAGRSQISEALFRRAAEGRHEARSAGTEPASTAYFSHLLDASGVPPRTVRCTRLADLVNTMDPKIVAATFGMDPEGAMFYLADHVDHTRLEPPNQ